MQETWEPPGTGAESCQETHNCFTSCPVISLFLLCRHNEEEGASSPWHSLALLRGQKWAPSCRAPGQAPLAPRGVPQFHGTAWPQGTAWGKASDTRGSLRQSKWGEKPQLWYVPCKGATHCWGSEPDSHSRLAPSAHSDEAESRYFSSLEREHQENGNSSWCFGVTSLGERRRPYSPGQGRWSSLLPALSPSFSPHPAPRSPALRLSKGTQQSFAAVLLQPELPCSSLAPLCQHLNCHTSWPGTSGRCSLQLWENKRLLFHLFLAASLLLIQLCPFGSSPDHAKNTCLSTLVWDLRKAEGSH